MRLMLQKAIGQHPEVPDNLFWLSQVVKGLGRQMSSSLETWGRWRPLTELILSLFDDNAGVLWLFLVEIMNWYLFPLGQTEEMISHTFRLVNQGVYWSELSLATITAFMTMGWDCKSNFLCFLVLLQVFSTSLLLTRLTIPSWFRGNSYITSGKQSHSEGHLSVLISGINWRSVVIMLKKSVKLMSTTAYIALLMKTQRQTCMLLNSLSGLSSPELVSSISFYLKFRKLSTIELNFHIFILSLWGRRETHSSISSTDILKLY